MMAADAPSDNQILNKREYCPRDSAAGKRFKPSCLVWMGIALGST